MSEPTIDITLRGRLGSFALDASFAVPARGVTALFGPSGCGKTTVLRCIAGLTRVTDGRCVVAGETWQDAGLFVPAHRRPIGYVFQDATLFPHLSVRGNLAFGAQRQHGGATDADGIVDLLALAPLLDRSPRYLSGGERQRVAIGRALLSRPKLLLMDEPLSALDRRTKDEIIPFLERLVCTLSIPIVYVTHDMGEVERLADTIVMMRAGRVIAAGPLSDVQSDPSLPLAAERDAAVSLDAIVRDYDPHDGLATLAIRGGTCLVPTPALAVGRPQRLRIAAGDVSLSRQRPQQTTIINILPARILSAQPSTAHEITAVLGLGEAGGGARLLARVTRRSWDLLGFTPGDDVFAQVKGVALVPAGTRADLTDHAAFRDAMSMTKR